jgi:alpha-1,6-mannosyltransferase
MLRREALSGQTLAALGGIISLEVAFAYLNHLTDLKLHVIEATAAFLAAGIAYFLVLFALEHTPENRTAFWLILGGALLFRLTLLPLAPTLSDDLFRYRFDGRVQEAGWNPYALTPDDPRLSQFHEIAKNHLPGHDIATVYPPLAELAFREAARHTESVVGFKLLIFGADLLVVLLLAAWLRQAGGRNYQLAVYAWSPLVVVEFAGSGHSDALALAALVAAYLAVRRHPTFSTVLLGAAALFKSFPVMLFPAWLRKQGWPKTWSSWIGGAGAAALAVASAWDYRAALGKIPATIAYYASHWENNNASLYALLRACVHSAPAAENLATAAAAIVALWAARRGVDLLRAGYWIIGAILLFSPNAYSWYFTWIIPFLCFFPNPAWLLLTILQFLSYHVLVNYGILGMWRFEPRMEALIYLPFYLLLVWQWARGRAAKHPEASLKY